MIYEKGGKTLEDIEKLITALGKGAEEEVGPVTKLVREIKITQN
jgi:hypothetical protein